MTVHLDHDDLEHHLRRRHTPARSDAVRRHLDACTPCWERWNAHRWDAARHHPLHDELAAFLEPAFRPGTDSSRNLADKWDRADPRTPAEAAAFFRASTSYLYNLVIWEASGHRPHYLDAALPALTTSAARTVLDLGSGIGSDAISPSPAMATTSPPATTTPPPPASPTTATPAPSPGSTPNTSAPTTPPTPYGSSTPSTTSPTPTPRSARYWRAPEL